MIEQIEYENCFAYVVDGKLHKPNGPARIYKYDQTDSVWFLNGQRHRYYGPYIPEGYWFIHDIFVKR